MFTAVAVVVTASLGWSALDLLRKLLAAKVQPLALLVLLTVGSAPFFVVWVLWEGVWRLTPAYWLPALASGVLNLVANLAFFESMRRSPLSSTIPLLSFTPVFATLIAIPLLGELPRPWQVAGIALVVLGAVVLTLPAGRQSVKGFFAGLTHDAGSLLMLLTALLWAATIGLDKRAMEASTGPIHALFLTGGIAVVATAILAGRGELATLRPAAEVPGTLAAALFVSAVALGLQMVALGLMMVSLIDTIKRGIGNMLAVLLGRWVFGEPITLKKVTAVGVMAAGVAVVLLT